MGTRRRWIYGGVNTSYTVRQTHRGKVIVRFTKGGHEPSGRLPIWVPEAKGGGARLQDERPCGLLGGIAGVCVCLFSPGRGLDMV